MTNQLTSVVEFPVRFSEVDSMQIVWHGHYVKYMEEGREDLILSGTRIVLALMEAFSFETLPSGWTGGENLYGVCPII